jgi:hypothetical protein
MPDESGRGFIRTTGWANVKYTPCEVLSCSVLTRRVLLNEEAIISGKRYEPGDIVTVWKWNFHLNVAVHFQSKILELDPLQAVRDQIIPSQNRKSFFSKIVDA